MFRVTQPYLNLRMEPRIFSGFLEKKYNFSILIGEKYNYIFFSAKKYEPLLDNVITDKLLLKPHVLRPNKKNTPVFRVTGPYLNFRFSGKNIILCILKGEMPFKMHKIIFFYRKNNYIFFRKNIN